MIEEVIEAFQSSVHAVFKTMLNTEIVAGPIVDVQHLLARHDVSGIIGLSGDMAGDVIVSFDEKVAILATSAMLGQEPDEIDNDVVDAVGELTNMIAGSAKGKLERVDLQLALPTVILGKGHRIGFKSGIHPISMPFSSSWGTFTVEVGLTEVQVPTLAI